METNENMNYEDVDDDDEVYIYMPLKEIPEPYRNRNVFIGIAGQYFVYIMTYELFNDLMKYYEEMTDRYSEDDEDGKQMRKYIRIVVRHWNAKAYELDVEDGKIAIPEYFCRRHRSKQACCFVSNLDEFFSKEKSERMNHK